MSISDKRIAASRANGAKSRGPISARGKAISAQNSARHSILANTIVLEGESTERFTALLEALQTELMPETELEISLIENMAACRWRQMRIWGMEKAGLSYAVRQQSASNHEISAEDAPTRTALAFRTLCDETRTFDLMNRYETRFDRQYSRALQRFTELRRRREPRDKAA